MSGTLSGIDGRPGERPGGGRFSARRLASVFLCMLSFPASAGDPGADERAVEACVPQLSEAVPVTASARQGEFEARDGRRFVTSDVHQPAAQNTSSTSVETGNLNAPDDLVAVAAGPENRWGLIPAWIVLKSEGNNTLLQALELAAGRAVFAPAFANGACADRLRSFERLARRAKTGLWRQGAGPDRFSAKFPDELLKSAGTYVIVSGRIVSLGKSGRTRYLNFGNYWKTDFTGTLDTVEEDAFDEALSRSGWQIDALAGKEVELRGFVQEWDGPLIKLRHPEQLVVIESRRSGRERQYSN